MDEQALEFDLAPKEVPVVLITPDKKDKTKRVKRNFILRQADEEAVRTYRDEISKGMRFENGKPSGSSNIWSSNSLLLSKCLFEVIGGDKPQEVPVSLVEVRSWVHSVVQKLVEKAKEISALDQDLQKERELAKNLQDGTTDTSASQKS